MDQVREVVRLVDDVLGDDRVGVYLHGSSVLGGLRPASDVDLLAVARAPMDDGRRQRLLNGLLAASGFTGGLRPVELTVVVQCDVRPWRFPPTGDFLYGEWLREEFESGRVPQSEPMPDLALLIPLVLSGDRPVAGPPPARVLDPVPHADLVRASVAGVPELLAEIDTDTRNVVLTLARVWATLATGEIKPKDAAADWALARLPEGHRPVLRHARDLYRSSRYSEEAWSAELRSQVRPHADAVLAEIARSARGHLGSSEYRLTPSE